jgi:antitoxin (DNA-binding transcriptional repressor) of toxin-antitoxin stability system
MKVANTVELKNKTNQLLRMVMKGEAVVTAHGGKPAAALTALTEDNLDDFVLERSPRIKKLVADAEAARLKGEVVSLEQYLRSR